jgi:type II secretory pathway pseudopilin PulG
VRPGHTLAEALCALALGGVLATAAGTSLAAARRALEAAEERTRGGRAEREAVAIVRDALEAGAAILARGDTAVELDLLVAAAVVCDVEPGALWIPPVHDGGLSALPQPLTRDDLVAVRSGDGGAEDWWYATVDSVQPRASATRCAVSDGWRGAAQAALPPIRLVLADGVPPALQAGADLRVYRRGRFALYHVGRGEWALGWRRCHPFTEACGPIQPVAGPLVAPGAGGFRITAATGPDRWRIGARGAGGRGASAEVPWR